STMDLAGAARPVRVASFDGRPVMIEGNLTFGHGVDVYTQAETLGFWDPDRTKSVARSRGDGTFTRGEWSDALAELRTALDAGELAVLATTHSSPTLARLRAELEGRGARWVSWSPTARDAAIEGTRLAFGEALRPHYSLEPADVIVSLDCDFMREHADALHLACDAAGRRLPESETGKPMSRIYAIESRFTSAGVSSDHRLPVRSSDAGAVFELIEAALEKRETTGARARALAGDERVAAYVAAIAEDIEAAGGRFAILPGESQPAAVHARVHALHARRGAVGTTVDFLAEPLADATTASLATLVEDMNAGRVGTLLMLGGNPVYDAPADLEFEAALAKCKSAHLSLYRDETGTRAGWSLPAAHWLEAWGDARYFDGTLTLAQPLILPLFDGKSAIELCALLLGKEADEGTALGLSEVRATHSALSDRDWRKAIHDGFVEGSAAAPRSVTAQSDLPAVPEPAEGLEVTFFACPKVYDGRFANNGWLQEVPDFTTKMTWDNAALIGVATAEAMGVKTGDFLDIQVGGRAQKVAAYVAPGQAEDSIALALGYGREHAGVVAGSKDAKVESAGFDVYPLRTTANMAVATGVSAAKAGGRYSFATTQEHHLIDEIGMQGRRERLHKLVMETDAETYAEHPDHFEHVYHVPKRASLFDQKEYTGQHQWGMTIDLSSCNGCNACVIACQAENNVPIVGKEQVKRGREMHWLRIDLYYQGDANDAGTMDAVTQPVSCLQCENAPCEQVCPVAATVHGEEGTNDMVYNRCIGTRYCANNCPYKVRRFNFFHYAYRNDQDYGLGIAMQRNPDVTVR
ncbi:MAG: 4Fe-4S dicluster domain-containing protein, partial [Planctomycetota bacterium]